MNKCGNNVSQSGTDMKEGVQYIKIYVDYECMRIKGMCKWSLLLKRRTSIMDKYM